MARASWGSDHAGGCVQFGADCHVRLGAELLAHTWDPVLIAVLRGGPRRRRDLMATIGGISDKALHQSLNRLLKRGLVARVEEEEIRYELTELGWSFADGPVRVLAYWAYDHASDLA
ncbi:helix-turn-helix domain-containing protein [Tsukamurella sp. 8F]|uniref:winged helix-turn-helix transcriptional regulator n=1 Tax=unclassified Tsukamurella TaxID=2633480 RepID=UPI0023B9A403|nr:MULTISPECIES: helix-turn-helix domain-containing protein [unclassified Tsukamurella]MDF0528816.1 helix-turn-helix domain-containing protein [Tsukamurella sp. 8J]MDF0586651.1 helix-turn-helix domain-containing protein [Tsukamurella sp. 8F]